MSDAPKSAVDIVMERLRQKDAESGAATPSLSDAQRTDIAGVRSAYEAQVAERRIMHQSVVAAVFDPGLNGEDFPRTAKAARGFIFCNSR